MKPLNILVSLLRKYPIKLILISIIIIFLFLLGIQNVYMSTGNDTLVDSETTLYQENQMLEEEFGGESIVVVYESETPLTPVNLAHMKELEDELITNKYIYSLISPVTLVEQLSEQQSEKYKDGISKTIDGLDQVGTKLLEVGNRLERFPQDNDQAIAQSKGNQKKQGTSLNEFGKVLTGMDKKLESFSKNISYIYNYSDTMDATLPKKQETLNKMIYDDGNLRPMFNEVVIDDNYMLMIVKFGGKADDSVKSEVIDTINSYLDSHERASLKTMVSGKPVLDAAIRSSMKDSMQKMMMLSIILMVIVLFFVFKVRWRLLPLGIILIAVIGSVGLMGWLSIPITMVSMAVFPILIGLGIDYAIQFQNRYSEEMRFEEGDYDE
ncbi:MMPL family transporter [Virgibacillus salinus]|uniref:MMPL family protein n=1 Tax=Virgibacillus salinus TaxID=553311 RepID=A0A1H1F485_9BACI|nr:MMPL family transporter [Virgibacillus salinus]SDQ95594.1 MMPL family protein [Virgibacillus salinus]